MKTETTLNTWTRGSLWRHLTFLALVLLYVQPLLGAGIAPPTNNIEPWLDSWSFLDTTNWTTDQGYAPISFTNLQVSTAGLGNSLLIDTTNAGWLAYNVFESGGATNLDVTGPGSLECWFSPNWASVNDTNELGFGPGVAGRLFEIGAYTTNASYGWWSVHFDAGGTNLYFSAQNNSGSTVTYLSAPVSFDSNEWHYLVLNWSSTNTALYLDGVCLTNGAGISTLPSSSVIANGFTIGSDAATGTLQMHGALGGLTTWGFPLDAGTIQEKWLLYGIFYWRNPDNLANFDNPPYDPGLSDVYDIVSGPGYLVVHGTNTTSCFTNSNVWLTNVSTTVSNNGSINLSFMVTGGSPDLPYDVFATTGLKYPISNAVWSWLGQAYPCETNWIYGLTNRNVFLLLGTPVSFDGDGFTAAFDSLMLHISPYDPDVGGDGIANGFKFLKGLAMSNAVAPPSLSSVNVQCCPTP